jgi:Domain of Unknown Function with PDB structure (DUF3861)
MAKRSHQYKLVLEYLKDNDGKDMQHDPISINFENHDDIFNIIELVKAKKLFADESQVTEFVIGLRLFTEILLQNSSHQLFTDLKPAIVAFMGKLKSV